MLLPEHKFIIEKVGPSDKTKDGKHTFQAIVLKKPGYTDEFGEKKGDDDLFEAKAWNKILEEMPVVKAGDKVSVLLALQGREFLDKTSSQIHYPLQLTIRKLKLI